MTELTSRTAEQVLDELRTRLDEWERNIRDHHESYLRDRDSISAVGSRAQLQLLEAIRENIDA